jgi:hypothetical protein
LDIQVLRLRKCSGKSERREPERACACFHSIYIEYQVEGGKSATIREFIFPMRAMSCGEMVDFGVLTRILSAEE